MDKKEKDKGKDKDPPHLCALFAEHDLTELARRAVGARYICKGCGRSARKKKWMCKPKALPE